MRHIIEPAFRKIVLAGLVFIAGPASHAHWGFQYHGPGMNHLSLLIIVVGFAALVALLFLLMSTAAEWWLWRRPRAWRYLADLMLFSPAFHLTLEAGLTARIVSA
jgi:hypothetical protein